MILNQYINSKDEILLYSGSPNLELLEELSLGNGDIWHSSFEQGFKNSLYEMVYQSNIAWWFV